MLFFGHVMRVDGLKKEMMLAYRVWGRGGGDSRGKGA